MTGRIPSRIMMRSKDELFARLEDRLGVVERDSSGLGQDKRFTLPREERLAEAFLKALGWVLSDDCDTASRSAARVRLPSLAMARK